MLVHRLNLLDALPYRRGYTIVRHSEELPEEALNDEQLRKEMTRVMRQDYAAIFDVAVKTAQGSSKPRFDTLIFRDVEIWADREYWEDNEALARRAELRRLFIYESAFFPPDGKEPSPEQKEQLIGLFAGILKHEKRGWDFRVLSIDDLDSTTAQRLLSKDWRSPGFQSAAAFSGHTVVFIKTEDKSRTLVHRFFNDQEPTGGKVRSYLTAFDWAWRSPERNAAQLKAILCEKFADSATHISDAFTRAKALVG